MNLTLFLIATTTFGIYIYSSKRRKKTKNEVLNEVFSDNWRVLLKEHVLFYNSLPEKEKERFEKKIQEFLQNCRITGIKTSIDETDKLLVAASAIIPIFGFGDWRYMNIREVLIYPTMFNQNFETEGEGRRILGMVGNGYLDGKMILSKEALVHGFKNESDKKNTAIHEFVHLLDKSDGTIDGIPSLLLEKQYAIPWIDLINKKIEEIYEGSSDINPYGGTNKAEFFSVASEYFFERPKLLKKKHPDLYNMLERVFNQNMSVRSLTKRNLDIGRNEKCPCNSGVKFKKCCGEIHYNS